MKTNNPDKEIAKLYYNLYIGCLKYKNEKTNKKVNCKAYYEEFEKFEKFSIKYVHSKETKSR